MNFSFSDETLSTGFQRTSKLHESGVGLPYFAKFVHSSQDRRSNASDSGKSFGLIGNFRLLQNKDVKHLKSIINRVTHLNLKL